MFGGYVDQASAIKVMDACVDHGINFIDTADMYGSGASETVIGAGLKGKRHQWVIATKFFAPMGQGPNDRGASRKHILDAVEASLRRLQTDHLDLYQIHYWDPETPVEETLRTLDDLVRQGKVRYIGCSNFAGWQLVKSLWASDRNGFVRFESVQPHYNLLNREIEKDLLPACADQQVGVIPYQILMGGLLTGRYKKGQPAPPGSRLAAWGQYMEQMHTDKVAAVSQRLVDLGRQSERTAAELLLGWGLANPVVTSLIIGASKPEQVAENTRAVEKPLTPAEAEAVTKAAE